MAQHIKWEAKTDRIVVAFVKKAKINIYGQRFIGDEAVRAIKEHNGWRVDKCASAAGTWLPWEPIVNDAFPTLDDAKKAIRAYVDAEPQS